VVRQQAAERRYLAHLDGVPIQASKNPVKSRYVTAIQQSLPSVEVPQVRLAAHDTPEPLQVPFDYRAPLRKTRPRQMRRQLAVQPPGPPLGAGEIRVHRLPCDLEPVPHARQQPVQLIVAQLDLSGQELADARLP